MSEREPLPLLPDDLRPALGAFLASQSTMALATAGDQDGRPQGRAALFRQRRGLNLYWVSSPDSRHSANIADWNDVSAAI